MKKEIFISLVLIVLASGAFFIISRPHAQIDVVKDETRVIILTSSAYPKQLLYENDKVKISIGYDQFSDYIEMELGKNKGETYQLDRISKVKKSIDNRLENRDKTKLNRPRDEFVIAGLLELGKASVFDKHSNTYIAKIYLRNYEYYCGGLCGSGHRYFYIPEWNPFTSGTLFFKVMDWVS